MSGLNKRRDADIERLVRLAGQSGGELVIERASGGADSAIQFQLNLPTAGNDRYPAKVQPLSRFELSLPARYPFEPPTARMAGTPIFHPNVFESGVICVGNKWNPSEGLDVYVLRLCRLLCFDGMLVNMNSIAHAGAGRWYANAVKRHPQAFPSARFSWDKPVEKVIRVCPNCKAKLRLPVGRSGQVQCPKCGNDFAAQT